MPGKIYLVNLIRRICLSPDVLTLVKIALPTSSIGAVYYFYIIMKLNVSNANSNNFSGFSNFFI